MKKLYTLIALFVLAVMSTHATTYTVAGVTAILNDGTSSWDPAATANDMTSSDGNIYTLTVKGKNLEAKGYEWKIVEDHAWTKSYPQSGNNTLTIKETAKYDITYTLNLSAGTYGATATRVGDYEGVISEKTYTVAGEPESFFGTKWDPTNTDNDMQKQADGTYKKVYTNKTLAKGTVKLKVVVNHNWDEAYPGSDYTLTIAEDGTYDVTVTFDPTSKAVNATAEKTGSAEIEKEYYVAGMAEILGVLWDPSYFYNRMVEDMDGTYNLYKKVYLQVGQTYEFKVVTNGSWDYASYPEGESNYTFSVDKDGWYEVYFCFDPADNSVWHELFEAEAPYYSLAGSPEVFTLEWDPQNDLARLNDNGDGTYGVTISNLNLKAGTYECKVCVDGLWEENYGLNGERDGHNVPIEIAEDGTYTIHFTFTLETKVLEVEIVNTTGIQAVEQTAGSYVIYNLAGQRAARHAKGILICNGKKVAVK